MKFFRSGSPEPLIHRWVIFSIVVLSFTGSAVGVVTTWPRADSNLASNQAYPAQLRRDYSNVVMRLNSFEKRQKESGSELVSPASLAEQLSLVQIDAASGNYVAANNDIKSLKTTLSNWNLELTALTASPAAHAQFGSSGQATNGVNIPILLYHYPPPNFEQQLNHLQQAGYTTIDLDQADAAMHGASLPPKPVVITFDDGFAVQMSAYHALQRHNMKATFYIIDGGVASRWCIGAGRRYNDPLQPPNGCGDAYLTWDQVRDMDHSGLITIAGHTINHRNLATLSSQDQRLEIITGKQQLEAQLGHSVRHFAYPYGAYNPTSVALAREAGYITAVTTVAGTFQPFGADFSLVRVRDALMLP